MEATKTPSLAFEENEAQMASDGSETGSTLPSTEDGFETASDPDDAKTEYLEAPGETLFPDKGAVAEEEVFDGGEEVGGDAGDPLAPAVEQDKNLVDGGGVLDREEENHLTDSGAVEGGVRAASPEGGLDENLSLEENSKDEAVDFDQKEVSREEASPENAGVDECFDPAKDEKEADHVAKAPVESNSMEPESADEKEANHVAKALVESNSIEPEFADIGVEKDGAEMEKDGGDLKVEAEKIGADGDDDDAVLEQNPYKVIDSDAETIALESNESKVGVIDAESDKKFDDGSVSAESKIEFDSADKIDGGDDREIVVSGVGEALVSNVVESESAGEVNAVDDVGETAKESSSANEVASVDEPVVSNVVESESAGVVNAVDDVGETAKESSSANEVASVDDVGETAKESSSENEVASVDDVGETAKESSSADEVASVDDVGETAKESSSANEVHGDEQVAVEPIEDTTGLDKNTYEVEQKNPSLVSGSDFEVNPDVEGTHTADDDENIGEVKAEDEAEDVANSETKKEIVKETESGSSGTSSQSAFMSSRDYACSMDGQIVTDSDEEVDTDEEGDGKELFDSAALAALLKAATGASGDGGITISSTDSNRIFSVDRPAGLGSSASSLKPLPPRSNRQNLFSPSDLMVTGEPDNNMDEEERKLHEKVELIRVKFLRLVQRLGHSPDDTVAAQVLYRLSLAEGIRRGRQINRAFSLESAKKKALQLEAEGKEDLDFSCTILVLGKTGVGKSSTINSIFGEEKAFTNAFEPATTSVREICGIVDGVKIRVIDTPGLRASVMDQAMNKKILSSIKNYTKRCPPDIVLYVDRLDTQTRDFNDLPLLKSITSTLGSSIWFNAIVALTHAASAPPDGSNGSTLSYEVFIAQRSHVVQHSVRQAAGDMRLMNPVALVENHPSCRRNREGERVLPNGLSWRLQMLLLCYSSKILSEANALLKLQDSSPGKLFGFRLRSPPLPFLLSSLLQTRTHPKLSTDQGLDGGDSDIDLDDISDTEQDEEEDEYDQLPPFRPLRKSQIAMLTKEQRKAYFEEYDYRVKLLQKRQWKEEIRRLKEMKKRAKTGAPEEYAYADMPEDYDQDGAPATVPVPLPDMVLPPTFDGDNPGYRYRFLEPTSQLLTRPVLDTHSWDHDCGYEGVSLEENLAIAGRFPAGIAVQITKDKKEFNIHMDSSVAAKHGENGSTLAGLDIQSVGKQLAYIFRGETKFKNLKKNKTTAGGSLTFLGETVAAGLKVEDQITIGKRLCLVVCTGAVRAQGDVAYGANLEARLREKDYPIGQVLSTLGLSLMRWRGDLALGANLQSQFSLGRNSKVAVRAGLNNKLSGQITVKTSSSENLQLAMVGVIPLAISIFRSIWPGEASYMH